MNRYQLLHVCAFQARMLLVLLLSLCACDRKVGEKVISEGTPAATIPANTATTNEHPESEELAIFCDVTVDTGIEFSIRTGAEADQFTILESVGSGAALIDYDGDGQLDVFLAGGGYFEGAGKIEIRGAPCKLYKNLGNLKFRDVTAEAGLNGLRFYSHGVAIADYDCDGFPDMAITGYGQLALLHNEASDSGGREFKTATEQTGLRDDAWSTGAGWADLNGDGYPELYVCHYVDWSFANNPICPGHSAGVKRDICPPQRFKPLVHALFANESNPQGGRRFTNVAAAHNFQATGCGLGVILADLNSDGQPDIYVANDAANNFLFMNRNGVLEEKGLSAGVAVDDRGRYNGSMGVDVGDFDGSGRSSLWVTNFQGEMHALYANLGLESFHHQSRAAGVGAVGMHLVAFGTGFLDIDHDGWEDLVFVNGHVIRHPSLGSTFKQKPILLHNLERKSKRVFTNISAQGGSFFETASLGRGLAVGDLDNDGWSDLVVTHSDSPVAVLRHVGHDASTSRNRWVGFRLIGRNHRDVVGSTVVVEGNTRRLTRFTKGGGSYLSAGDNRLLFGLGGEAIKSVTVSWSWGEIQKWDRLESGAYWNLIEGVPDAVQSSMSSN